MWNFVSLDKKLGVFAFFFFFLRKNEFVATFRSTAHHLLVQNINLEELSDLPNLPHRANAYQTGDQASQLLVRTPSTSPGNIKKNRSQQTFCKEPENTVPNLRWFNNFLTLRWCKRETHSEETALWILIFSWASNMWYNHLSQHWTVAASCSSPSASHQITRINKWHTRNRSVFYFQYSFNKLHETFNTLL